MQVAYMLRNVLLRSPFEGLSQSSMRKACAERHYENGVDSNGLKALPVAFSS